MAQKRKALLVSEESHSEMKAAARWLRIPLVDAVTDALREWLKAHRCGNRKMVR